MVQIKLKITGLPKTLRTIKKMQTALRDMQKASKKLQEAEKEMLKEIAHLNVEYTSE